MLPDIFPVACHTNNIGPGSTFVAIKGAAQDGTNYISLALAKGARKIVVASGTVLDSATLGEIKRSAAELVYVKDTRLALAQLSASALGHPAQHLKILAITGTKGKTTTTFILEHLLSSAGKRVARLSTVSNAINGTVLPTRLTTQQPDYLNVFFDACCRENIEYVVMEVAAQAFSLHRVAGLKFAAGIFTNFSKEHGEFYATMDDYFAAKQQMLNQLAEGAPLFLNKDDARVAQLARRYNQTILFSSEFPYQCPRLIGAFNQYNCSAAALCAEYCGLKSEQIREAFLSFAGVPGRMETYPLSNGAVGIVDYAHNPSSYQALLTELRSLTNDLIVVFGCGGERDAARRPLMGAIASELADAIVVTADNPRSEDARVIAADIISGVGAKNLHKVTQELDRERAIKKAHELSCKGSYIVVLGKGPDEYQIIGDTTYPFSDRRIVKAL